MIVDSSVLIAILQAESDSATYAEMLEKAQAVRLSAANFLEAAIVVDGNRNPVLSNRFDSLVRDTQIEIVAVTETQARLARAAYRDYGKGSGHRAQLNFGDCFAYALAKESGEPLLYKGDDFIHTDLRSALDVDPR